MILRSIDRNRMIFKKKMIEALIKKVNDCILSLQNTLNIIVFINPEVMI